ncbi:TPA: collagen binding domain-containing protein [Listeria monocytogenes]
MASSLQLDESGFNYTGTSFTNGKRYDNAVIWNMKMDGKDVFCIDSGAPANTESGYSSGTYMGAKNEVLSKIAYYGFTKTNQSYKDFATTQLLIWETLGENLEWTSLPNYWLDREAILNKIKQHDVQPSWNNQVINLMEGEELVLEDTNNVTSWLNVTNNMTGVQVKKDGNRLKLKVEKEAESGTITFSKVANEFVGTSTIFNKEERQSLVDFRLPDNGSAQLKVNVQKLGEVELSKSGQEYGIEVPNGNYMLEGAQYGIYNHMDERMGELITDRYGKAVSMPLPLGSYYLLEEKAPLGYLISNEKISFKLAYSDLKDGIDIQLQATDVEQKGTAKLVKEDAETGDVAQGSATLDGAIYELYRTSDDTLVDTVTIKNGQAQLEHLLLDSYYWLEKEAPLGYQLNTEKHAFDLAYNSDETIACETVTVQEKVIKENMKVIKCDENTKEPIKNNSATFKLKDVQTGEFVEQGGKSEFSTNMLGEFTIGDLPYGDYELVEVIAPTNYQLKNKSIPITVDGTHDGMIEVRVMNNKIPEPLPKKVNPKKKEPVKVLKKTESKPLPLLGDTGGVVILLLGLGLITTSLSIYWSINKKQKN